MVFGKIAILFLAFLEKFPGKSFGLKFILKQSDLFRLIPEFVSELIRFNPIKFQSRSMQIG